MGSVKLWFEEEPRDRLKGTLALLKTSCLEHQAVPSSRAQGHKQVTWKRHTGRQWRQCGDEPALSQRLHLLAGLSPVPAPGPCWIQKPLTSYESLRPRCMKLMQGKQVPHDSKDQLGRNWLL